MFIDLKSGDRGECVTDSGIKHTEIIVNFRCCTHSASWISCVYLLFYCYCRRQSFDIIAFRFGHAAKELSGICGKTFDITTLTLCIQSVERKRRLTTSTNPRYNYKFIERQRDIHILQIVYSCPLYDDILFFHFYIVSMII